MSQRTPVDKQGGILGINQELAALMRVIAPLIRTAFLVGASVATWSEVVIGSTTIMLSAFLLKLSLVLAVFAVVALIVAVIFGVFWYIQARLC